MKLTIVSHQVGRNDGQGRVNYEIARGALSAGWEVTIVAMRCAEDLLKHGRANLVSFNVGKVPTQLLRNLAFATASAFWIRRNRRNIDILHVNGGLTLASSDVNTAHFVHTSWLDNTFFPFKRSWLKPYDVYQRIYTLISARMELPAFRKAHSVVAISKKVANELQDIGIPSAKITVICNGVDTDEFCPGVPERAHFGLPEAVPIFLFAGDIRTSRKNLDTVLSALVNIQDLYLAVAGDTAESPFPNLAARLGLSKRVFFLGHVKDMSTLMRSVDAFVFPSRYDPAGLVILEAMASGIPVITSKTAGAWEIMGSAGCSLDDPNDVNALTSYMRDLKENAAMRKSMGELSREIAMSHNWQAMADQYRRLYVQVKQARTAKVRSAWISSQGRV